MAVPSTPITLPFDNEILLQQLASTIQSGIRSAADSLLFSYTRATTTLPPTSLHHLLKNLFSSLEPAVQRELVLQLDLLRNAVLALPPDADEARMAEELSRARDARSRAEEQAVDAEIAAAKAGLRDTGIKARYLNGVKKEVQQRVEMMEKLSAVGAGKGEGEGEAWLQRVEMQVAEAEGEYKGCVSVLNLTGGGEALVGGRKKERRLGDDEHAPLCSFVPSPMGVLDLEVDEGQLKEWTTLKERLLG